MRAITYTPNLFAPWMLNVRTPAARHARNVALFALAPFIGLAYAVAFPLVGLAMLAWMALRK